MFSYRNIITVLAFIVVCTAFYLIWSSQQIEKFEERYQLINDDDLVIMVDTTNGITWRFYADCEEGFANGCWKRIPVKVEESLNKINVDIEFPDGYKKSVKEKIKKYNQSSCERETSKI